MSFNRRHAYEFSSDDTSVETVRHRILRAAKLYSNGCWDWQRAKIKGYGQMKICNKPVYAHRASYEAFIGPIPDGLTLDHICRNRACVNPAHLEPVTMRENLMRSTSFVAVNAAKTHCYKGHPLSGENLYLHPDGSRACRTCRMANAAAHLARKRAAIAKAEGR